MRVLVAIDDGHRIYRGSIGRFLKMKRAGYEARLARSRTLYPELPRFGPEAWREIEAGRRAQPRGKRGWAGADEAS